MGLVCSGDGAPATVPVAAPPEVTEAMILQGVPAGSAALAALAEPAG